MAGGTLTEKKRCQWRCNLLLLTAMAMVGGVIYALGFMHLSHSTALTLTRTWWLFASIPWFWGLAEYAKSKGQSPAYALLGFFSLIGLIILACLPDRFILEPDKVSLRTSLSYGRASRERW
jgi:hypothetical protein